MQNSTFKGQFVEQDTYYALVIAPSPLSGG